MTNDIAPKRQDVSLQPPQKTGSIKIDYYNVKKAALILRALNHKLRQQLLKLIEDEKKITVTEIYVRLKLEQSVASQHLAILRKTGFVNTERDGKNIYYFINHERFEELNKFATQLLKPQAEAKVHTEN